MVDSALLRVPALAHDLGPVAASTLRLASRFANALRAGHAAHVDEFSLCDLILIQSPRAGLPAIIRALLSSSVSWCGRAIALIDGQLDSSVLDSLRARGAHACAVTFSSTGSTLLGRPLAVAEGDPAALRVVRTWTLGSNVHMVELRPGARHLFTAGLAIASALIPCVVDAAVCSLRTAGLSSQQARRVIAQITENTAFSYTTRGRRSRFSPASAARWPQLEAQLAALAATDPALARFQRRALAAAAEFFWPLGRGLETADSSNSGASLPLQAASILVGPNVPSID